MEIILNNLPKSYDNLVTNLSISSRAETISFEELSSLMLQQEQKMQRYNQDTTVEGAFLSNTNKRPGQSTTCFRISREPRICYYCGKPGPIARDCRKEKHDLEKRRKHFNNISEEKPNETTFITTLAYNLTSTDIWYVDSGASRYMTSQKKLFEKLNYTKVGRSVELGNDYRLSIKGVGTCNCR